MRRIMIPTMLLLVALVSVSVRAAGNGEVVLKMNGGDDIAYIGEVNTLEVWIKNDAPLSALELSFGMRIDCDGNFAWGEEFREASMIGAFDNYSTYVSICCTVSNLAGADGSVGSYLSFLGGATHMGFPDHDTLTLCYYLIWEFHPDQEELPHGMTFENVSYDKDGTIYPIGERYSWSFTDESGEYAPDFNGFANESTENPTAPAVSFHVINRDRSQCCQGVVGDVNGSGEDIPTIGDVATLIDHLYINGDRLFCVSEADMNQSGGLDPQEGPEGDITIADVSQLIDHLFISRAPLPACQ